MTTETITEDIAKPAPAPISIATIFTDGGNFQTPCEPINEWLAITAVLGMDADGKTWLTGTFVITHLPSGRAFTEEACINCCRNAGRRLNREGIDWTALKGFGQDAQPWVDALTDKQRKAIGDARSIDFTCDAEYCDEIGEDGKPVVDDDDELDGPQITTLTTIEVL